MSNFNDALYAALKELNKRTNGDRIRAMTDEELATIIFYGTPCAEKSFKTEDELLVWLRQEAVPDD